MKNRDCGFCLGLFLGELSMRDSRSLPLLTVHGFYKVGVKGSSDWLAGLAGSQSHVERCRKATRSAPKGLSSKITSLDSASFANTGHCGCKQSYSFSGAGSLSDAQTGLQAQVGGLLRGHV